MLDQVVLADLDTVSSSDPPVFTSKPLWAQVSDGGLSVNLGSGGAGTRVTLRKVFRIRWRQDILRAIPPNLLTIHDPVQNVAYTALVISEEGPRRKWIRIEGQAS